MGGMIPTDNAARNAFTLLFGFVLIGVLLPMVDMAPTITPICQRDGCNCTITAHYWVRAFCTFNNQQAVEIVADSLPLQLLELEITECQELNLSDGSFSRLQSLQRVRLRNIGRLRVRRNAFNNLAAKQTLLEIIDCGSVVVETNALKGVQGPVLALISRCSHVIIQNTAFSWMLAITVKDVPRLELAEKAFSFEKPRSSPLNSHGPATTVLLQNVIMSELPPSAFPSSAAELRLDNVEIRTVRRDAFCALQLSAVIIHNSSLHRIETGAFSERTLIENLEISGVRVRTLASNAISGAIQHLTIQHSRFSEVVGGAISITVAKVTVNGNVFEKIRSRGFIFNSWNRITIDNNIFQWAETEAFSTNFNYLHGSNNIFQFTRNEIADFGPGAFRIAAEALEVETGLTTQVSDNKFTQGCRCNIGQWIREVVTADKGSQQTIEWFFNTSFCTVDSLLAKCFNVPQGFVSMSNFTDIVCGTANVIVCEEASQSKIAISVVQNVNNQVPSADDSEYESELDREKKVLALIFLVVVGGIGTIVMITMLMWLKRHGYCVQARIMFLPSTTSCLTVFHRMCESCRGGSGIVAAGSISRLNVREYNDLHQPQQRTAMLANDDDLLDIDNEFVPVEDKWTQTLPEELTQELLQSLREKLDDPENYSEARDMIEHLYDLIKVEESCSNNNTPSTSDTIEVYDDDIEENLYDVIQLPISTPAKRAKQCDGRVKKAVCHVGTRAPSPDKLLPAATYAQIQRTRRTAVITDYAQPKDHETHLYAELPGGPPVPPPKPPPVPTSPIPSRGPSRPLSFLRALGESLITPKVLTKPLVTEYADPTDVVAVTHEYSELPNVSKCNIKMANRPLPSKPVPGRDPDEGTSVSST